jgi:xanthine dehydrogenase YagT iron-sulfur-binding subunit
MSDRETRPALTRLFMRNDEKSSATDSVAGDRLIHRRALLERGASFAGAISASIGLTEQTMSQTNRPEPNAVRKPTGPNFDRVSVSMTVNGQVRTLAVEPRMTLLDALREELTITGTKKGCDRGECGACTVHINGRRVLSCMTLAAMQDGKQITTIEGLERNGSLHPLQATFIEHDGFQCGFCTAGQIMSGVALIEEAKAGWPSAVTPDVRSPFTPADLSAAEIRERMSGNLCRCACYPNIVAAVSEAARRS